MSETRREAYFFFHLARATGFSNSFVGGEYSNSGVSLTSVRDFDTLSLPDRQSSCLHRRDLLHRGFRQKRAIYIPRYTHVRFLRPDGISKRRDVSPTAMLHVEITRDYVRRNCSTCSMATTK